MSQILSYATFRSRTDLIFMKHNKEAHLSLFFMPPHFFYHTEALRGKSRVYAERLPLNWRKWYRKNHILIATSGVSFLSLKISPEWWEWCRTFSGRSLNWPRSDTESGWKDFWAQCHTLAEGSPMLLARWRSGRLNHNTNHGSYLKDWGERDGMIYLKVIVSCGSKRPQFLLLPGLKTLF